MNKHIIAILAATAVAGSASAQSLDYSATLDVTFSSQYVFRGVKLAGPALQPSLEVSMSDITVGVWASNAMSNYNANSHFDTEVDFYGGYDFAINDSLSIPVGVTYYWYPRVESDVDGAHDGTIEVNIGVNFTYSGLTLSPKAYYDFDLEGFTFEGTAAYSFPIEAAGTSLDFSAFLGWSDVEDFDSFDTDSSGGYWGAGVVLPYAVAENATVSAGVMYHAGFSRETTPVGGPTVDSDDRGYFIWTLSATVGW